MFTSSNTSFRAPGAKRKIPTMHVYYILGPRRSFGIGSKAVLRWSLRLVLSGFPGLQSEVARCLDSAFPDSLNAKVRYFAKPEAKCYTLTPPPTAQVFGSKPCLF